MIEYMTPSIAANAPGTEVELTQDHLWQGLLWKAEFPTLFVKPIVGCEVIDRMDDGILREIEHVTSDVVTEKIQERIFYVPQTEMTFLRLNGSVLGQIVNEILPDENGELALRFGFTLALEGAEHGGPEEAEYLEKFSQGYIVAVQGTLAAVREAMATGVDPTLELAKQRSERVAS